MVIEIGEVLHSAIAMMVCGYIIGKGIDVLGKILK